MKITKGTQLQFKAGFGRWREVTAREDFDTNEDYWKLTLEDKESGHSGDFNPRRDLCKLRILKDGKPKLLFDKKDILSTRDEIEKINAMVFKLMKEDERCRNDDEWLTFKVCSNFTKIFIPFEDFKKLPSFATIRRVRAQIQNVDKELLPTIPEVAIKRRVRDDDFRAYFGKSKGEFK